MLHYVKFVFWHPYHNYAATLQEKYILKLNHLNVFFLCNQYFSKLFAPIMTNVFSVHVHNNRHLGDMLETDWDFNSTVLHNDGAAEIRVNLLLQLKF